MVEKLIFWETKVIKSDDEREVYFFMAYLAQKGENLAFDISTERADYELIHFSWYQQPRRKIKFYLQLSSDVKMPLSVELTQPFAPIELERLAEELVSDLDRLLMGGNELVDEVLELRDHAEAAFKKLGRRKTRLRLISLDLDFEEVITVGEPAYRLSFKKLGADAQPMQASVVVGDGEEIDAELASMAEEQELLFERMTEYKKGQADGAIDAVLLARLERHGLELATVLRSPAELETNLVVASPDGEIRLAWRHGILTANMPLKDEVHWVCGGVNIRGGVPGIQGDLTGRQVSDLIQHPDLPDDLIIASGNATAGKSANFHAVMQYMLFDKVTGLTW